MLPTLTLLLAAVAPPATDKAPAPPAVGATVPDLTLKDTLRRPRSLAGYKDARAFVVVFVGTECPLANLYFPTLAALHKDYAAKGVQFLAINSNNQDGFLRVAGHARERDVPFPVLKDFDHKAADTFGARRTPEAFLLDAKRVIRYRGRIDDQYGLSHRRDRPTRRDLKDALDQLLAGKPISTPTTDAPGCFIGRASKPRVKGAVTYAKHVAPILQKRCQECHRPGEVAPMSLLTYGAAKNWARTIREVVNEQRMPPWHADPAHGQFLNDRSLTQDERDTLLEWVDQGCAKGEDRDLPPPAKFAKGWKIGTPDAVFQMPASYTVAATGVLPYKQFTVDPGFKTDVWVRAAECRPGNTKVVHHIIVYIKEPNKPLYALDGTASSLAGWAPGDMPTLYPPDTAKRVPAGAKLVFEVHYTPDGTEQTDRSSVGLIYAKAPPKYEATTNILSNMKLAIPPRAADYRSQLTYTFPRDALLLSFMPHMHLRGTAARYDVVYPDGKKSTLLSVPDYDFGWQSIYRFKAPLRIPKGTKLTWSARWDNSADNPRNPDPSKRVTWGLQTFDEMQNGWMDAVWLNDEKKKP